MYAVVFWPGHPVIAGLDQSPGLDSVSVNAPLKHEHAANPETVAFRVEGTVEFGHSEIGDGAAGLDPLPHAARMTSGSPSEAWCTMAVSVPLSEVAGFEIGPW